jgi:hypothetical protein
MIFYDTAPFDFNVGDKVKVVVNCTSVYYDTVVNVTNRDTNFPIELIKGDTFTIRGFYLASEDTVVRRSLHNRMRVYKDLLCSNLTRIIPV